VRGEKGFCRGYCWIGRGVRISVRNWEREWILGGWIERSQGRPFWSQREEVQNHSRKALIQVRGVIYVSFILVMINYAMCEWNCMCSLHFMILFAIFWILPRNCLAVLKVRQATHTFRTQNWVFFMHRLAARCCPPGDTNWFVQFLRMLGVSVMLDVCVNLYDLCMIEVLCDYL